MSSSKLTQVLALSAFAAALAVPVLADDKVEVDGTTNWREHQRAPGSSGPLKSSIRGQHLGSAAPEAAAGRTIELRPGTKYVNVVRTETVKLVREGKSFTWNFDTLGTPNFNLAEVAPRDFPASGVRVYVAPSPWDG